MRNSSVGLLEGMERYVAACEEEHGAEPLVVMGSTMLTSNVFSYVVGSVTLSAIKRLAPVPVVVVTANTKQVCVCLSVRVHECNVHVCA